MRKAGDSWSPRQRNSKEIKIGIIRFSHVHSMNLDLPGDLGALDESDVHRKYVILANYISSPLKRTSQGNCSLGGNSCFNYVVRVVSLANPFF